MRHVEKQAPSDQNSRTLAKAMSDPFYAAVVRCYGAEHLPSAGFFDDGAPLGTDMTIERNPRFLVTPITKVKKELARHAALGTPFADGPVVVVASGAFCPLHIGHMEMMESAKRELERRGRVVVGGFLAPDHDGYVGVKCGEGALSSCERVYLTQVATAESSWLNVDPWAALYLDRAVNYTDIVRRLATYLKLHVRDDIEVAFVCGADNAGFSRAFVEEGMLVIVPRGDQCVSVDNALLATGRILVAHDHMPNSFASRAIRGGSTEGELPAIRSGREALERRRCISKVTIRLRDEEDWLVEPWTKVIDPTALAQAQRDFASLLRQIFEETLRLGERTAEVSVTRLSVSRQREVAERFAKAQTLPIISLDACIPVDISVGLSRHFEMTDGERIRGLFPRPGCPALEAQIAAIPPGRYILMDDDIATGQTVRDFVNLLPSHISIDRVVSIYELECEESLATVESEGGDEIVDVGDVRDFLVGAREGGLVVKLPNSEIARVPYLLPYAQNSRRMSLPLSQEREFSLRIWKLNERFFNDLPEVLRVRDASQAFQSLARYLGFDDNAPISSVCTWHIKELL